MPRASREAFSEGAAWHLTAAVRATIFVLWALAVSSAIALSVPAAWLAEARVEVPGFAVAAAFLLAGAGLHFAAERRALPAKVLGALTAAAGLLVIAEHHLFVREWTLPHGPCTVSKALILVLAGAAISLARVETASVASAAATGYLGAVAAALGLGELAGFAIETQLTGDAGSSMHTMWSFGGLAVLGAGIVALASRDLGPALTARAPRWLATAVSTFLAMGAFDLFQATRVTEGSRLEALVTHETATAAARIEERLESHVLALERMGKRWEHIGGTPRPEWEADAADYLRDRYGYQAIAWVDSSQAVRWIVPRGTDLLARGLDADPGWRKALGRAREARHAVLSPAAALGTPDLPYLLLIPLQIGDSPDGFLVGELRADRLLQPILEESSALGYGGEVLDGASLVAGGPAGGHATERWASQKSIRLRDRNWRIRMWPTSRLRHAHLTALPGVTLAVGLAIACLVGFSIDRSGLARYRERKFRTFLESAPHPWVSVDTKGRIVQVNSRTEAMLGYRRDELIGQPVEILVPDVVKIVHLDHRRAYSGNPQIRPIGEGRILHARRKDGSAVPVEISLSPVATDDGLVVFASLIDVSHRIEMERKLWAANEMLEQQVADRTEALERRARELERANAELERFNRLAVGREHRMIALKREVNELVLRLERKPQYDLSFLAED